MSVQTETNEAAPAQLERFQAFVLDNVALHEELRQPTDLDGFVSLAVAIGRRYGFSFAAQDVAQAIRTRHMRAPGGRQAHARANALPPSGWLPARALWQDDQLYIVWLYFGDRRLSEAFFEHSVRGALQAPFNLLFEYVTPIARLPDWLQRHPGLSPSGLIFHMSRCGSSLVAQMLGAVERNLVISEASPLDAVVQARAGRAGLTEEQQALWLRWMAAALAQPRCGERTLFLKLDSWHTLALPLFRRAFPSVPWVFLYRDPVEVIVSHMRAPGIHTVAELGAPDILGSEATREPHQREDYCARILARICEPVLAHADEGGRLINYRDLPAATWTLILPHFGMTVNTPERAVMAKVAGYDAKVPGVRFTRDVGEKQKAATPEIRAAARERLGTVYDRLETRRGEAL